MKRYTLAAAPRAGGWSWLVGGSLSQQSRGTVQWRVRHFVLGCDKLTVAVDHKPLLGLLNDKSLADIENPRLLMLKEKTLWFNFNVIHVAGRLNSGPDYISRTAGAETTTKEARVGCILALASIMSDSETVNIETYEIHV